MNFHSGDGMLVTNIPYSEYAECKNAKYILRIVNTLGGQEDLVKFYKFLKVNVWNVKSGYKFYSGSLYLSSSKALYDRVEAIQLRADLAERCLSAGTPAMVTFRGMYITIGSAIFLLYSDDLAGHFMRMDVEEFLSWWVMTEDPMCSVLYPIIMLFRMDNPSWWSEQ